MTEILIFNKSAHPSTNTLYFVLFLDPCFTEYSLLFSITIINLYIVNIYYSNTNYYK